MLVRGQRGLAALCPGQGVVLSLGSFLETVRLALGFCGGNCLWLWMVLDPVLLFENILLEIL